MTVFMTARTLCPDGSLASVSAVGVSWLAGKIRTWTAQEYPEPWIRVSAPEIRGPVLIHVDRLIRGFARAPWKEMTRSRRWSGLRT